MNMMLIMKIGLVTVAWAAAFIIAWRSLSVLHHMSYRDRGPCPGWRFIGFGLCYAVLAVCGFGSAIVVSQADFTISHVGFLMSSAGLIVCDRRCRRKRNADNP